MNQRIQNLLGISIIIILFLSVGVGFWYVQAFVRSSVPERSFQVTGEGKVIAVPDVAELSFGVITEGGKDLGLLQKENSEKANSIIAFLKEQGIDEKDIKTTSYNISPRYQYFSCQPILREQELKPCPPPEIVGYTLNQSISVKIRDFNKLGEVLTGVVERGANNVSGPNFTIDDPTKFQNQAREEAIRKAKEKAEVIAKAGGFRLGKLLSLQEGVSFPSPIPMHALEVAKGGEVAPQIEPGSQEVTVTVTLTYEIK